MINMTILQEVFNNYWIYGLYLIGTVAFFRVFKRPIRKLHKMTFAAVMDRFARGYNRKLHKRKENLFAEMQNMILDLRRPIELLEIGAGSGANFKYYPRGTNIMCVDPNPHFESYLKSNSSQFPHVNLREFLVCRGEDMSQLLNSSVDAVVCTLVMCSVDDVDQCLREIKRVLRPGGKFFFLEHVAAENTTLLYKVQHLLTPGWKMVADGCHLTRETWKNINEAQFSKVKLEQFRVQSTSRWKALLFPPVVRPHCIGIATK